MRVDDAIQPANDFEHLYLGLPMSNERLSQRIHIAFVNHTAQLGGGEIALRNLLERLDQTRFQVSVVLCADGPLVEQIRKRHPVRVIPMESRIGDARKASIGWTSLLRLRDVFSALRYTWRLSRSIRLLDAQAVHTNSLKAHLLGGIAGRLAGVPVIWHMRDRIAPDYLPQGAVRLVKILSWVIPTFIVANSQATLDTLTDGKRRAKSRVVHDGCEVPVSMSGPEQNQPVKVGLIGRISPWKGQHIFIQAAGLIRNEFPDVRFQIIGAPLFSEFEYESELKRLTADLQLERQVEFTGFVRDVQGAIEELQIVVHASTVGEPFGQVVIEGMAAGRPVIATNGGGVPEIVVDQVTGLLVPMNDARALADAMASLLRNPGKGRAMGARGRRRVEDLFTIERSAKAVEQVYLDLLSPPSTVVDVLEEEVDVAQREAVLEARADYE